MKRPILTLHLFFFAAAMLLVTQAQASVTVAPEIWWDGDCYANCASFYRHDDRLLVIGKNGVGDVVATGWVGMDASARGPSILKKPGTGSGFAFPRPGAATHSGLPVTGTCLGTTGTCVDQSVLRFETNTHLIIVTVTYFFINGELHDIDVREKRFAKNKIK